ncbi:hypothetical protein C6P40_000979 [Pichia californica]|uniref:Uncharacterized protein n=1 Tax=Pichia californica TaxID=460514 RepID=A0A9P6WJS0_9ASCO|nr:hypothetical protein C6P42_000995 [[Candida] californica]KAG0688440.1 hypothetical protein C6P40_000979 [[Candida] californica]
MVVGNRPLLPIGEISKPFIVFAVYATIDSAFREGIFASLAWILSITASVLWLRNKNSYVNKFVSILIGLSVACILIYLALKMIHAFENGTLTKFYLYFSLLSNTLLTLLGFTAGGFFFKELDTNTDEGSEMNSV